VFDPERKGSGEGAAMVEVQEERKALERIVGEPPTICYSQPKAKMRAKSDTT
jgi:hypothetical protein